MKTSSGWMTIMLFIGAAFFCRAETSPAEDASQSQTAAPIKLAFIGASITAGFGTADHEHSSYPAQLGQMLDKRWELKNFGVSGTTLMHSGDTPYIKTPEYKKALEFKPDILVIDLGANDSKSQNFEAHPDDFIPDYKAIIEAFRKVNPKVKIYAALPVPAFPENFGIRESVIEQKIIPAVLKVVEETHISKIDLHTSMMDKGNYFPDKIHPNEYGARALADIVYATLKADYPKETPNALPRSFLR